MGGVRTSFKRMISRMSRYSRILSNNSTGRLDRLAEGIQVAEGKRACDRGPTIISSHRKCKYRILLHLAIHSLLRRATVTRRM